MPPQRRRSGKGLGGNPPPVPPMTEDDATEPVSPLRDAEWGVHTVNTPPPEPGVHSMNTRPPTPTVHTVNTGDDSPDTVPNGRPGWAPLRRFAPNPDNPRFAHEYDPEQDEAMRGFGETVGEYGVLQALTVCPLELWLEHRPHQRGTFAPEVRWVIGMGGRRFASAQHNGVAGLSFVRNDTLADPQRAMEVILVENIQRTGLDPIQEAGVLNSLLEDYGIGVRELARRLGRPVSHVSQRRSLLRLISRFQALVSDGALTVQKALPLTKLSPERQQALLELGPPYVSSRLNAREPDPSAGPVVLTGFKIAPRSTPGDVVKTMTAKLEPEMLTEIARLLRDELNTQP